MSGSWYVVTLPNWFITPYDHGDLYLAWPTIHLVGVSTWWIPSTPSCYVHCITRFPWSSSLCHKVLPSRHPWTPWQQASSLHTPTCFYIHSCVDTSNQTRVLSHEWWGPFDLCIFDVWWHMNYCLRWHSKAHFLSQVCVEVKGFKVTNFVSLTRRWKRNSSSSVRIATFFNLNSLK